MQVVSGFLRKEVYFEYNNGYDTDFVVKEGMAITKRIRVWYEDTAETAVPDSELACFRKLRDEDAQAECILITNDHEDVIVAVTTTVRCVPLVKFLLFG